MQNFLIKIRTISALLVAVRGAIIKSKCAAAIEQRPLSPTLTCPFYLLIFNLTLGTHSIKDFLCSHRRTIYK